MKLSLLSKVDNLFVVDYYKKFDVSNFVKNGYLLEVEEIKEVINNFIEENAIIKPSLLFAIPNKDYTYTQTKIFTMPTLKKKDEMKNAIEIEVEDLFSAIGDDKKIGWGILDDNYNGKSLVYATCYNKRILDSYEPLLKDLKYSYSLIPKNLFISNLVDSENKTVLLVDLGSSSTDFIVCRDNKPILITTSDIAGQSITDAISSFECIELEDAEYKKINDGLVIREDSPIQFSEQEVSLSTIISTQIDLIIDDIKRVVDDLTMDFGLSLDQIFIFGGSSRINFLDNYIEYKTEIPTEVLLPEFLKDNTNEILKIDSSDFIVSFAASMVSFSPIKCDLSFVNKKNTNQRLPLIVGLSSLGVTSFIIALVLIGNFAASNQLTRTTNRLNEVKANYEEYFAQHNALVSEMEGYNAYSDNITNMVSTISQINNVEVLPADPIKLVKKHTPKKVQMDTLKIEGKKVIVEGVTSDYMNLGYFIKELEKSFDSIDFEYDDVLTDTAGGKKVKNLKFKITMSYNR